MKLNFLHGLSLTARLSTGLRIFLRTAWIAVLLGGSVSASQAEVLLTDTGESGDFYNRGFYIPRYPGTNLQSVTLEFSTPVAGAYKIGLQVRAGSYNSRTILGDTSEQVTFLPPGGIDKLVTFEFPLPRITKGSTVCFIVSLISGPSETLYYSVPGFTGGNTNIIETDGTDGPLDTFRRFGVKIVVIGQGGLTVDPGDSIQAAIDRASPGDTVLVKPGTYNEDIVLRDSINVVGSGFRSTILKGTGTGNVVRASGITDARFEGFKITGSGTGTSEAGIRIAGGDLMVNNNWIYGNINGILLTSESSSIIRNNIIEANGSDDATVEYGICCLSSSPLIANNLVVSNRGVGIYLAWSNSAGAQVINNTIAQNAGSGIWCYQEANATLKNNISTGNVTGISASHGAVPEISFNNLWQNTWLNYDAQVGGVAGPGPGDISVDPMFATSSLSVPFSLKERSPCINAGDPDPLYNDYDGSRNDMGAYGGPTGLRPELLNPLTSGFLFSSVGRIPTSEITQTGGRNGLANVSTEVANDLLLYQFTDAPFGGALWLHGLFGFNDTNVVYYKILGASWNGRTAPIAADFQPLLDPLTKIKYTVNASGKVTATREAVGPDANGFYLRTSYGYWAFPDLMLILNSARLPHGLFDITCKAYNSGHREVILPNNDLTRITLWIDNSPVRAEIVAVTDPQGRKLQECDMVRLSTRRDPLQFEVIAHHPNGFLRNFFLDARYGRNRNAGNIALDQYAAHASSGPLWHGPNPEVFNSAAAPVTQLADWADCAYQFHLEAWARTTDGYNHIYAAAFDDHYSLYQGPALVASPDLNGDGVVDGVDVAIFATYFGKTNLSSTLGK
jgi:parallel beta-helix repeat protein